MNINFLRNNYSFAFNATSPAYGNKKPEGQIKSAFSAALGESKGVSSVFKHFEAIKNYNLAFAGKKESSNESGPIYAIDAYKDYHKFDNADEIAIFLNLDKEQVLEAANGEIDCLRGFVFSFSNDIENIVNNKIQIDDKMLEFSAELIKTKGKKRKRYPKIGNYVKQIKEKNLTLKDVKKQEKPQGKKLIKLEVKKPVARGVKKQTEPKIEKQIRLNYEEQIKAVIERQLKLKLQEQEALVGERLKATVFDILDEDLSKLTIRQLENGFYVMDQNRDYKKCYVQTHVANSLGINKRSVNACLNGESNQTLGLVFARASEVESFDKDNKLVLNLDALENKFQDEIEIYAFEKTRKYEKYSSPSELADFLGVERRYVMRCLNGNQETIKGLKVVRADEFETKNEDGTISVNQEKIDKVMDDFAYEKVYLVDKSLNADEYKSEYIAAEALDVSLPQIRRVLNGHRKSVKGVAALWAKDFKNACKNGTLTPKQINIMPDSLPAS